MTNEELYKWVLTQKKNGVKLKPWCLKAGLTGSTLTNFIGKRKKGEDAGLKGSTIESLKEALIELGGKTASKLPENGLNHSVDALLDLYGRSTQEVQAAFLAGIGAEVKKSGTGSKSERAEPSRPKGWLRRNQ